MGLYALDFGLAPLTACTANSFSSD